jgi:ankyrin repeat protein
VTMRIQTKEMVAAIHLAAAQGDRGFVDALIENGARPDARDAEGVTPLHLAAEGGHADVAEFLIAKGADVNCRTRGGWTPLHGACAAGHLDVALLLLDKGADLSAVDSCGHTPLGVAVRWRRDLVSQFLISIESEVDPLGDFAGSPAPLETCGGG